MNDAHLAEHIKYESLHHAYFIEGERGEVLPSLHKLFYEWGVSIVGNPDYHEYIYDSFVIDRARELKHEVSMHSALGGRKYFVICWNSIISETQHALLKTLEEPTAGTHLFFIARSRSSLLPTVLSRMQVIGREIPASFDDVAVNKKGDEVKTESRLFLAATVPERFKMIEPIIKAKADEKPKAKEEARILLGALEHDLYKILRGGKLELASSLEHILFAKNELSGRAPSMKLLLEHLALTIPKIEN